MTNLEFIEKLKVAVNCKTLYVKGGFGLTLNAKGKERAINSYKYNAARADKINAMPNDSFGFDCCGLVKGTGYWGFDGDPKKVYGGAVYKSNGMDDVNELGLIKLCSKRSGDMNNILIGELLYMKGHCGVYIGDGKVIESTPTGKDGVQITTINYHNWTEHGQLPDVEYGNSPVEPHIIAKPTLRKGSKGMQVDFLQKNLNATGAQLSVDGQFGPLTYAALKKFQSKYGLEVDGIYGPRSYAMMREVLK